jgi:asparagine synthase (glutamine-hydrolysing)
MCGIAGVFQLRGVTTYLDEEFVRSMTAAQSHRGPDDGGQFRDDRVVLGHRRLSIIDLSPLGRQPMSNEDGSVWITYNGEIYNFQDLARGLSNHRFRSHCDTEVLLHGYEEWGMEGLLNRVRGMFAFALYDSRASRCYLVRDRLGIKPLYYSALPDRLAFASEVKALTHSGVVPDSRDPRALVGLMLFGSVPSPRTSVHGIQCLMPGTYLSANSNGVVLHKYWDLDTSQSAQDGREDAEREFRAVLQDSVTRHMVSDVSVGVYLSGGVDSAALVALASHTKSKVVTLTLTSDDAALSEGDAARDIAHRFGADHREIHLSSHDFIREVPNFLRAMDQPTTDGVNSYFVARAARQAGVTVALSGLGGDEVFGGYRHHRWLARRNRSIQYLSKLPAWFLRLAIRTGVLYGRLRGREKWMRLSALNSGVGGSELYLLWRGFFAPLQVCSLMGISEKELQAATEEFFDLGSEDPAREVSAAGSFRYIEFKRYLHDQALRDTDVFSMAHSIEVRVPFLDHVILDQVAKLPRGSEFEGRGNKPLLTRAVGDQFLSEAALKPKRGFSFPFRSWMRTHNNDMKEMAMSGGYLDRRAVSALWQQFESDRLHWSRAWMLSLVGAGK